MASDDAIQFFNDIINKGCCKRCALRYLGVCKTLLTFDDPETCLINFGYIPFTIEPPIKTIKRNPCTVCLGLLHDTFLEEMLTHENLNKLEEYQSKTIVMYITYPTCISVRDHSMRIYLKQKYPNFDDSKVIKINNAWRYSIQEKLCKKLKKKYDRHSKLTVHFYTGYALEADEMAVLQSFVHNQKAKDALSKHFVTDLLNTVSDEIFISSVTVPPKEPLYEVTLEDVKYFSEAIYLIGNYCKYSRRLLQAPLILDGEVYVLNSVENIIIEALKKVAGDFKDVMFKATSFDERSVRVLGTGRTFHLQISDPKFESIPHNQCREIEKEVKKSKVVSVQNLREEDRRDIAPVMESEQLSPKSYKVLCIVYKCKNIDYCVNAVNMYQCFNVYQKTPIRFCHDRAMKTKLKKVLYIKARRVEDKDNVIELDLCAEGGFYVQEFVNGDFGRTSPSLGEIMKAKVDFLAMDVVDFFSTLPCAASEEDVII